MRSTHMRVPALAIAALAFSAAVPAFAADTPAVEFVAGTGIGQPTTNPLLAPAPAPVATAALAARQEDDAQAEMTKMAEQLADPKMQDDIANMMGRLTQTMMKLPIGKIAARIEQAAPGAMKIKGKRQIRENDTIADLAGRDADRLPGEIAKGSKQMMGMLSGFAAAFATMIPEFEKMGDELERGFEDAKSVRRD